ncbi:PREDICTED: agamous MADS-box [Prunus dulcis]|uniref:PREDICTED: agamous MADS-box n=1 Tax=Prunus dulcis TaxID=3755 RepID=A0A5E4F1C2_PRUDU|nr:PREDICTED: agamous MADS-box [Prunus dulcis]
MADSMARKTEDLKRQCKNSFPAEESYQGAMSGSKRHATMHRKAEALEKLCNARVCMVSYNSKGNFSVWPKDQAKAREIITDFRKCSRGRKMKKRKGKKKGYEEGFDEKEKPKLDQYSKALETHIQILEENINSFQGKTKTIQPNFVKEDHGEESMAELLEPNSYNFNNGPTLQVSGDNNIEFANGLDTNGIRGKGKLPNTTNNIKFSHGFDINDICDEGKLSNTTVNSHDCRNQHSELSYSNVKLEFGYNGDFGLVELVNFGGVDNYNPPPLGSFPQSSKYHDLGANLMGFEDGAINNSSVSSASLSCWVDMLQGRNISLISPLHEALLCGLILCNRR